MLVGGTIGNKGTYFHTFANRNVPLLIRAVALSIWVAWRAITLTVDIIPLIWNYAFAIRALRLTFASFLAPKITRISWGAG